MKCEYTWDYLQSWFSNTCFNQYTPYDVKLSHNFIIIGPFEFRANGEMWIDDNCGSSYCLRRKLKPYSVKLIIEGLTNE